MPHYTYSRGARRKKLFTRISSTFIKNKPNSNSSILESGKMLHSKSTYFYRWGSRLNYVVPSMCGLALLVGGLITINPILNNGNKTHATGIKDTGDTGESTGSDTDNTPSISIAFPTTGLPEGFNNEINQTTEAKANEVVYRDNIFDITVNNADWYAILVRAANGYSNDLKNGSATITGVGQNVQTNSFGENTWGYALTKDIDIANNNLTYNTIPENSDLKPAYHAGGITVSTTQRFKLTFAAKFGNDAPSGHYTTKVYLSAVTNPLAVVTAFGVTTMQEMSQKPTTCRNAKDGTTDQLVDVRDNKLYWVTKMKDGNCWMTQNLDFDIPAKLYYDTSDVGGDASGVATNTSRVENITDWSNGSTYNAYYDPGDYIYISRSSSGSCSNKVGLNQCPQFTLATTASDMHYHIGNYYSWGAAKVNSMTGYSICPTGWNIPNGASNLSDIIDVNGTFANVLDLYGLSSGITNGAYSAYGDPFYLTYGGMISNHSPYSAGLNYAGRSGYYWMNNIQSSDSSYRVELGETYISPASWHNRFQGYSVRCYLPVDQDL